MKILATEDEMDKRVTTHITERIAQLQDEEICGYYTMVARLADGTLFRQFQMWEFDITSKFYVAQRFNQKGLSGKMHRWILDDMGNVLIYRPPYVKPKAKPKIDAYRRALASHLAQAAHSMPTKWENLSNEVQQYFLKEADNEASNA